MKNGLRLILVFILFSLTHLGLAQTFLKTQAEVNDFVAAHPNITNFNQSLWIGADLDYYLGVPYGETDIYDLSGLSNLTQVEGDLVIVKFKGKNLGLDNLETVNGKLWISGSSQLEHFDGLPKLRSIEDEFLIGYNGQLLDLKGLEYALNIGAGIVVDSNSNLVTIDGLEFMSVGGELLILDNHTLDNLNGLKNMHIVYGRLAIANNLNLTDISGANAITKVKGELLFHDNPQVESFNGFEQLIEVDNLKIYRNNNLKSLPGLDHPIELTLPDGAGKIEVYENGSLPECAVKAICDRISIPTQLNIHDNDTGCNLISEIETACILPIQKIFPSSYEISILPNPTTGLFEIQYDSGVRIEQAVLFNSFGQKISTIDLGQKQYDLSPFGKGLFFIQFTIDNQIITQKIIRL